MEDLHDHVLFKFSQIRRQMCFGCMFDSPDEKKHECLTQIGEYIDWLHFQKAFQHYVNLGFFEQKSIETIGRSWYQKWLTSL